MIKSDTGHLTEAMQDVTSQLICLGRKGRLPFLIREAEGTALGIVRLRLPPR